MAAEDYSIRINVDSSSATQAQANLNRLNSTVTQTERELNNTSSAARSTAASLSGLQSQTSNLNNQLNNTSSAARNAASSLSGLNTMLGAFGISIGAIGAAQLAKNILHINMEMEALRARLQMTMPSLTAAQNAFGLIVKIAKETPQSIEEITKAFLLLKNSGLDTSEKSLRGWTDAASKFGGTADMLTGVIRQFGQATMKGALHAQDANAMIERGIPLYGLLTQATGKSADEIIKMMEAGELNNKIMQKTLDLLFEMSSGSSAMAMDTMKGKIEALGSAWTAFVDALMQDKSEGIIKRIIDDWASALEGFTDYLNKSVDRKIADKQARLKELELGFQKDKFTYLKPNTTSGRLREYEEEGIALTKLLNDKQKGIDETAFMQKDALAKKQAEEIQVAESTRKAIENGDNDALKKFMSAKLSAIKENDKQIIKQQAETASISAKLAMSIVAVESTGKPVVNSQSGAAGLMQVMPENYKKAGYTQSQVLNDSSIAVKLGLKVWQDSMDVAKKAVIKGTIEANQQAEFAAALYTTKHQTIYDRIKKNKGIFDINLFKEASDWWNKVTVGMELQNQSVAKTFAPYNKAASESAQETKKLAHEQEQAAKKTEQAKQRIYENSPIGKYLTDMAELNKLYGDDKNSVTYQDNAKKIADTFLKATVDLSAYNQELAKHKKYLEDITDYNATIDELTHNKHRGAITSSEYGLGVAQANAGLMNKVTDKSIPVNQTAEVIDAKNIDESAKALTKLDDLAKKTTDSFKQIGDSGKMAFDGLLGGISAVASAATNFGDVMEKLNENHADYAKNYTKFMADSTKSESDKASATTQFAKEKEAYDKASFAAEISGARQVAGAASKMFGEKSAARKAFHAIEMGLSVIEMAMSIKKIAMNAIEAVTNQGRGDPYSAFPRIAAMAALMAAITGGIVAISGGGSGKTVDNTRPATDPTGTILGDNNATSNSVERIVDALNDIHAQEYPELKAMADNFRGLDRNMYKLQQQMARATVNFTNMQGMGIPSQATGAKPVSPNGSIGMQAGGLAASTAMGAAGLGLAGGGLSAAAATAVGMGTATSVGVGVGSMGMMVGGAIVGLAGGLILAGLQYGLGKLLGIGKTKITQIGEGIVINSGKLLEDGMTTAVDAQTWRKDSAKTKGWFSSKTRIIETYGQLSDEIAGTLQGVSDSLTNGMYSVAKNLNVLDVLMYKFTDVASRPFLKIDFFGKDGKRVDDTNKVLTDQINAWVDRTAKNVFGILFGEYQKLNEGMMETVARLAIQVAGVKGAYAKLGFDLGKANLGLVHFSDTMAQIFQSSAKADDGLKNFIAGMNEVYEFATNQGQKSQLGFTKGEQALKDLGLNVDITDTVAVKAAMLQLSSDHVETIQKTTEAQESLRKLQEPVEAFNNPQFVSNSMTEVIKKTWGSVHADWAKFGGVSDVEKMSYETIAASGFDWVDKRINTPLFAGIKALLDEKALFKSNAASQGGASIDLESLTSQINDANAEIEVLGVLTAKQVDATQYLKEVEKTNEKLEGLQDEYLKKTLSAEQFLKIERERIIKEQYDSLKINMADFANLSEITNAMIKAGFEGVTKETQITAAQLQRFVWSLEETDKALKKLSEGGKYLMDFSRSIDAWIRNLRATSLGNPESQKDAAKANFGEQMKLAQFGSTAEIKRQALSGITGYADTYINALRNYYASSEEGVNAIEQVIKEVSGLEKGLSIQELQLNELQSIKDAIENSTIEIPKGINENLYKSIIESVKQVGDFAKSNPTVENQLKYDAFASIVLAVDKSAKSGADAEFLNKMISSIGGKDELFANIKLVINSAEFSASQKESIINGVLADFNRQINFDVAKSFETEIERVNNAWLKVELPTTTTDNAKTSVIGLTGGLKDLNGQYDVVSTKTDDTGKKIVDFSSIANNTKFGLDADSVANTVAGFKQITDSALAAKAAMNDLAMADAKEREQPDYTKGNSFLESDAVNAGYSGDYTDTAAMEAFLNPSVKFSKSEWIANVSRIAALQNSFTSQNAMNEWYSANPKDNPNNYDKYAMGGIAHTASIFGEAGAEAAVPLPDGRTIPVTLSRDSANDNGETVAELKEISRKQEIMINTLIAAAQENRKQNETLVTEIEGLRTDTRLRRAA